MTALLGAAFALGFYAGIHYLGWAVGGGLELATILGVCVLVSR